MNLQGKMAKEGLMKKLAPTGRQNLQDQHNRKKVHFFPLHKQGRKFWRNRKHTICAMLVSVHDI